MIDSSIIPAFITYGSLGLGIYIFVFFKSIDWRKVKIVLYTFTFIISGFAAESLIVNKAEILQVFKDWKDVLSSPPLTIIATAIGIFVGNRLLKLVDEEHQRRTATIFFLSLFSVTITILSMLEHDIYILNFYDPRKFLHNLDKLKENLNLNKDLSEISKFSNKEVEVLSEYYVTLWQLLTAIEQRIISSQSFPEYTRLKVTATKIYAGICSWLLAKNHWKEKEKEQRESFYCDFHKVTDWIKKPVHCPLLISQDFIKILTSTKNVFENLSKSNNLNNEEIYKIICLPLEKHDNFPSEFNNNLFDKDDQLLIGGTSEDQMIHKLRQVLQVFQFQQPQISDLISKIQVYELYPVNQD